MNLNLIIMKKITNHVFIIISLLITLSCNRASNSNYNENPMSKSDSLQIVNKVIEITDDFANANNRLDGNKIMDYWHYNEANFIVVENTTIHPSGEELFNGVQEFYSAGIDTTFLSWTKRKIIPITNKSAHLYGEYDFYLKLKTGETMNYHVLYSALLCEINGNWKALRVHESYETGIE